MMTGKLLGRKFPGVKRSIQTGKESVPLFSDGENGRRAAERAQIEMPRTGENSLNLPLHISIPLPSDHMHQNQAFFTDLTFITALFSGPEAFFLG